MLEQVFVRNLGLTMAVWMALFAADYYLTLVGARLQSEVGKKHFESQGSYELTPYFQSDIDRQRTVSPRFLIALAVSLTLLGLFWVITVRLNIIPEAFAFAAGGLILRACVVIGQHVRNIATYSYLRLHPDEMSGTITYGRKLVYRNSATDLMVFAGLMAVIFAVTGSWFVLGGSLYCAGAAVRFYRLGKRQVSTREEMVMSPPHDQSSASG